MIDFPTRLSIWLALGSFTIYLLALSRKDHGASRTFLSLGLGLYLAHVFFAFQLHFDWSHSRAVQQTAVQTAEVTGLQSGFGIYVNYLLGLVWGIEVFFSFRQCEDAYFGLRFWSSQFFFQFMILNGAIVFAPASFRWLGISMLVANGWALQKIYRTRNS